MEAFLIATGLVVLAEIGDKTQLLALMLALQFRKPAPIIFGILVATLANHALAGVAGVWVTTLLTPETLRILLGLGFLGMAVWVMIPDTPPQAVQQTSRWGVFLTTLVVFFLVEMGDKTQIATVALAIQYPAWGQVILGTTLGMLLANVPVVLLGNRLACRIPLAAIHASAALLFAGLGLLALQGAWH